MDINRVGKSNVISIYKNNVRNVKNNKIEQVRNDSIEISNVAKNLSGLSMDVNVDNSKKVERIRNEISSGTYKPNAELVAKKLVDLMKGRGI